MVSTIADYDSRPGPIRDAIARARHGWLELLESQARAAQRAGDIPDTPAPALVAFEVDALLSAANLQRNLTDDSAPLEHARELIALRLARARPPRRRP